MSQCDKAISLVPSKTMDAFLYFVWCLSVSLYFSLLSVCLSICLSVFLYSICLSVGPSARMFVRPSVGPSAPKRLSYIRSLLPASLIVSSSVCHSRRLFAFTPSLIA